MRPQTKDRFRRLRRLGSGGTGVVYEALDLERGGNVAMKTLLRTDGESLLRFKREFRTLQDIEHPNLVKLYELLEVDEEWFITMELVEGVNFLRHAWRGNDEPEEPAVPSLREHELRAALGQLALGLAALHGAGKIHCDIKPSNVLVTPEGRVVILDLGLVADQTGDTPESGRGLVGTPAYMAPEQTRSRPEPASDCYAVGVMLFQALTGSLPFQGRPFEILQQKQERRAPTVSSLVSGRPADLERLCADLLERDPNERPSSRELLSRLDAVSASELTSSVSISMRQMFVGREAELEIMSDAYASAVEGSTVSVVLHGPSGLGKSALIREFVRDMRDEDADDAPLVLVGRCYENESLSYNAFDGVIDALSTHLSALPVAQAPHFVPEDAALLVRAFPVLAEVAPMATAPMASHGLDPDEMRARMLIALQWMFCRLSERAPLIITIDDVQWANRDSLLLLSEIVRPPDSPRMLLLISARGDEPPELELAGNVRNIAVTPLAPDDARALAESLLLEIGLPVDRADAIAAEAQGHPLHIDALVRYAMHAPEGADRPKLDQAIVARLDQLPDDARRVLELVCLAGGPISRAIVAHAAELNAAQLDRALSALRLHNLARASGVRTSDIIEPSHDRVRESVSDSLEHTPRVAHHTRLAAALELLVGDSQLLMRHQRASGNKEKAALTALRAARAASDALAFDRAAVLYDASLRMREPPAAERRDILWRLSVALENAGRGEDAATVYVLAAEGAEQAVRLEAYRRAAEQLLKTGHIERGLDALRELLAQIGAGYPKSPQRAMASVLWTRAALRLRGLRWTPRDESQLRREHLTRVDIFLSVGQGIGMVDNVRGAAFQSRGLLMALRAGEPGRIGRALALEAIFLGSQGGRAVKRARALLDKARELSHDDAYIKGWVTSSDGIIAYLEGRFEYAVATLRQALALWREQPAGNTWEKNNVAVFQLLTLRLLGRNDELHQLVRELLGYARRLGDRYLDTTIRRIGNRAWLCRDDPAEARRNLEATDWAPPEGRYHLQHWWENEARSELAIYEGRGHEVFEEAVADLGRLRGSLLTRIQMVRVMANWLDGRLHLLTMADEPSRRSRVLRVASSLERESIPYATNFAHLLRGALSDCEGRTAEAVAHYRRLEDPSMKLAGLLARRRVAQLTGDHETLASTDVALRGLGVMAPDRCARLFVMGHTAPPPA